MSFRHNPFSNVPQLPPTKRETFEHNICPDLLFSMERLRDGLELFYGRNNFLVFGDIMQLTVRVYQPTPVNLKDRLQQEGFLRCNPVEVLPKFLKERIQQEG
ncbi:hypothetical protein NW762_010886, partial [Fusarium torreyae]